MISFILPTLESDIEGYLYDCLDSIVADIPKGEISDYEAIVIIKPGRGREDEIRSKILERYGDLVHCEFSSGNRSVARNAGLRTAKNNIIAFLDSDTRIGRGFTSATIRAFEHGYGYVNYSTRPLDEEVANKRRSYFYAKFMNFNQALYTYMQINRSCAYCVSVEKRICEQIAKNGEVFLERLAGRGEDAEFGSRYGTHCRKNKIRGKYEGDIIVKTSFREYFKWGFWRAGARMIINTFIVPYLKRPLVGDWK